MDMSHPNCMPPRGTLTRDEPMAKHVTWRAGGAARSAYRPAGVDDLCAFLRSLPPREPVLFVGLGSNLLVRDGGFAGTVVFTHHALTGIAQVNGRGYYAGAGVPAPHLARFVAKHGGSGAEWMAGVPGTVGGALAMNAGCYGGETWRHVARVETLPRSGTFAIRTPSDYRIGYRSVQNADGTRLSQPFTAAWFRFPPGDIATARAQIKTLLAQRIATQPLSLPNAGSVFRNPPGDYAARLIESCGLKGHAIGGARVSERHANFIVNPERRARAADIEQLVLHVQAAVQARMGILLEPEVRMLGEPS